MEREEKLINILEERQEEAIRRIAYNNRDSVHSANSLSSTNSNSGSSYNSQNAGRGGPAGGPGGAGNGNHNQFLPTNRSAMVRSADLQHTSPVGWDKSYPLRPMGDPGLPPTEPPPMAPRTPSTMGLYKRNSTVIFIIMIQILHIMKNLIFASCFKIRALHDKIPLHQVFIICTLLQKFSYHAQLHIAHL